MTQESYEALAR